MNPVAVFLVMGWLILASEIYISILALGPERRGLFLLFICLLWPVVVVGYVVTRRRS